MIKTIYHALPFWLWECIFLFFFLCFTVFFCAGIPAIIEEVLEMKVDWKRKLTSRKFWLSVASFVSMLTIYCGGTENKAAQTAALIMAGATIIGYVIGEGLADSGNTNNTEGDE